MDITHIHSAQKYLFQFRRKLRELQTRPRLIVVVGRRQGIDKGNKLGGRQGIMSRIIIVRSVDCKFQGAVTCGHGRDRNNRRSR
jgi:hypothetical protein